MCNMWRELKTSNCGKIVLSAETIFRDWSSLLLGKRDLATYFPLYVLIPLISLLPALKFILQNDFFPKLIKICGIKTLIEINTLRKN